MIPKPVSMASTMTPTEPRVTPTPPARFQPASRRVATGLTGVEKPPPTKPVGRVELCPKRRHWADMGNTATIMNSNSRFIGVFPNSRLPFTGCGHHGYFLHRRRWGGPRRQNSGLTGCSRHRHR